MRKNLTIRTAASLAPLALFAALLPACQSGQPTPVAEQPAPPQILERIIETDDGVALRVRTIDSPAADAPTAIYLTGGPGFAAEQLRPLAESLLPRASAVLLDQRGTGGSAIEIPPADRFMTEFAPRFSIERMVADVEAVRADLDLERVTLVGHSWGSILAMAYACEHPDRVERIVLIGPAGADSDFWPRYQATLDARLTFAQREEAAALPPPTADPASFADRIRAINRIAAPATFAEDHTPEELAAFTAQLEPGLFNPLVNLVMQRHVFNYDLKPRLVGVTAPTLIVQGDQDPLGRRVAERIEATMPNATLRYIEDCGHWPFIETPDQLTELASGFIAGDG